MAEIKYLAELFLIHYHCDTCNSVMQFAGENLGKSFKHICSNKNCNNVKYLENQYPFTTVNIPTNEEKTNERNSDNNKATTLRKV